MSFFPMKMNRSLFLFLQFLYQITGSWNEWGMRVKDRFFPAPDNRIPTGKTEIVIESFGGSASKSFVAYVRQNNPGLEIATDTCSVNALKFGLRRNLPVVYIVQDPVRAIRSVRNRYAYYSAVPTLLLRYFMNTRYLLRHEEILVVGKDEVLAEPRRVVESINTRFGLTLGTGDNRLPRIRTEQDVNAGAPTPL